MPQPPILVTALQLAATGLPVLPLRAGKLPVGNCSRCRGNACGGRPHMKTAGPCRCPAPCHAWAAATTNPSVLTSRPWATSWREARAVAYHPAGAHLTVVDLDTKAALEWAQATLPATRTVPTSRGQHWIYQGTCPSTNNALRNQGIDGVDIKSARAYARWLGWGSGTLAPLPAAVSALAVGEEATPAPVSAGRVASSAAPRVTGRWDHSPATGCRHTTTYLQRGLDHGLAKIRACLEQGAGSQAFGVARFLASRHQQCPGPCALDHLAEHLIAAATHVGVPEDYARRAVRNGLTAGGA